MKGKTYGGKSTTAPKPTLVMGNPNVVKEAMERKKGGRVDVGEIKGKKSAMRLDRPGRKSGGRVGADQSPLSSAAKTTDPNGYSNTDDGTGA